MRVYALGYEMSDTQMAAFAARLSPSARACLETIWTGEERKPAPLLLTEAQAADRLGCSVKTLRSHIAAGELHYVQVGRGRERICRKFTVADLDAFVALQTRTEVPQSCPSAKTRVRRIGASTSNIVAIGFSAQPKPQPGAKRKR
jgi:excisionase family DNA binding protein